MEILNQSKVRELAKDISPRGSGKKLHPITRELMETFERLSVGEGFIIQKTDWHFKTSPSSLIRTKLRDNGSKRDVSGSLLNGRTKWLITRTK